MWRGAHLYTNERMLERNVHLLEEIARILIGLPWHWVLGGDVQNTLEELVKGGFPKLAKGVVAAPLEATCKGRVIDYFVVSEGLAKAQVIHYIATLSEAPYPLDHISLRGCCCGRHQGSKSSEGW